MLKFQINNTESRLKEKYISAIRKKEKEEQQEKEKKEAALIVRSIETDSMRQSLNSFPSKTFRKR